MEDCIKPGCRFIHFPKLTYKNRFSSFLFAIFIKLQTPKTYQRRKIEYTLILRGQNTKSSINLDG